MANESRTVSATGGGGRWSNYALDTFYGPHLSALTECSAPEVPEMDAYIMSFTLNFASASTEEPRFRAAMILIASFIQHVSPAIIEYGEARKATLEYVSALPERTRVLTHGLAVARFEHCILQASNAQTYLMGVGKIVPEMPKLYEHGDLSDHDRLNRLGNRIRHFHEDVSAAVESGIPEAIPLAPIWLTNDGVYAQKNRKTFGLTFAELAALLTDFTATAKTLAEGPR